MASSRATTSAVSLEDWDALAPLSLEVKANVNAVIEACAVRPLPARLAKSVTGNASILVGNSNPNTRPATPMRIRNVDQRIDGTDLNRASGQYDTDGHAGPGYMLAALDIEAPIDTALSFLDWYGKIEATMETEQEEVYHRHATEIDAYVDSCNEAMELLEDSRGLIKEMEANYRFVEDNSKALQLACEALLYEQRHLLSLSQAINTRLEYFRELDIATRALSQPGDVVVLQQDFLPMLERLDECIAFLKTHRAYLDAEVYLIRFQQCLTRAMTLIKLHLLNQLTALQSDVSQRLSQASGPGLTSRAAAVAGLSEAAAEALLYGKFAATSQAVQHVIRELEKRGTEFPAEYGSLLQDCLQAYFAIRTQLLVPSIAEEVRRMASGVAVDVIKWTRTGCAYLRGVCQREWTLFRAFFRVSGQAECEQYLEILCDNLYDSLRPRILHEPKLETLGELCTIIQAIMTLDGDLAEDTVQDQRGHAAAPVGNISADLASTIEEASMNEFKNDKDGSRLRFSKLLSPILQDTRTRLIFRAQYMLEASVFNYTPTGDDLDYPGKLKARRRRSAMSKSQINACDLSGYDTQTDITPPWHREHGRNRSMGIAEEDGVVVFRLPGEPVMEDWYPTLRTTLHILSKLHSYVETSVFEDFAGEAVTMCRQSLSVASEKLANAPKASRMDAQLFIIRHLLILKEMVRSIDLVSVQQGVDLSSMTDLLSSVLRNTSSLFTTNTLFQLASNGIPVFTEIMRDAKRELDHSLKLACEDFMVQSSLLTTSAIRAYLTRCQAYLSGKADANKNASGSIAANLAEQPWATADVVKGLHDVFLADNGGAVSGNETANLTSSMQEVMNKMRLYLDEEQTVAVLLPPVQSEVVNHYTTFYNLVRSEYDFSTSSYLQPPSRVLERLKTIAGGNGKNYNQKPE